MPNDSNLVPTFLTTDERTGIRADVDQCMSESNVNAASVTYRRNTVSGGGSATVNLATGAVTDPFTSSVITVMVGHANERDAKNAGVELEATDRKFLIDRADLGADPEAGDIIVYSSTTYEVVKVLYSVPAQLVVVYATVAGGEA